MTATPAEGSALTGWSGPCLEGVGDAVNECTIHLTTDQAVTAIFDDLPDPEIIEHARSLAFSKFGHGKNPVRIVVKGVLTAGGFTACSSSQELMLQKKRVGFWTDKSPGITAVDGTFRLETVDRQGTYRVVAAESDA